MIQKLKFVRKSLNGNGYCQNKTLDDHLQPVFNNKVICKVAANTRGRYGRNVPFKYFEQPQLFGESNIKTCQKANNNCKNYMKKYNYAGFCDGGTIVHLR